MTDADVFASVTDFCKRHRISTSGVLVFTAQKNRSSEFTSVIADFEKGCMLTVYPAEVLASTTYKEMRLTAGSVDVLCCYGDNLPAPPASYTAPASISAGLKDACESGSEPFCCGCVQLYKNRRLDRDAMFDSLRSRRGHHPNVVFEVKRQVNNGPMLSTKYYQVVNNELLEVHGSYSQKLHAFKNFKCSKHDLFFGVDLYQSRNTSSYNTHHMRLNPFEHRNIEFLRTVLAL